MKVEEVRRLKPLDVFMYWVKERYQVALRRKAGRPKPWTDDEVLQNYFFTHPYREMDKVTVWFRKNIREPLRNDSGVLMATVIFRWFNRPETAQRLMDYTHYQRGLTGKPVKYAFGLLEAWNPDRVLELLCPLRDAGEQIFTGAYMINSPPGEKKLEAIVRRINNVWEKREELLAKMEPYSGLDDWSHPTKEYRDLEEAHKALTQFDGMGGFMAYEVVCDLRYTYLLENAPDKCTWANPGPGAVRGLYRVLGRDFPKGNNATSPPIPKDWSEQIQWLLGETQRRLGRTMPPFEAREIEHSLCETDKYMRLLNGDGRAKRTYQGAR